jgi:UPF0176 protein
MYLNIAHYFFVKIENPESLRAQLEARLANTSIVGTILIAPEGTNCNLAGDEKELLDFANEYFTQLGCQDLRYRSSYSETKPYKYRKIRVKAEIITMGHLDLDVAQHRGPHISPEAFRELLNNPGDTQILDTRNDFEVEMGSFKGAVNPRMRSFRNFPEVANTLDKEKPVVMFCTGGVRCEKASAYLLSQGFKEVKQLEGGILAYLNRFGKENWHGDCFVFDERIRYPV